MDWLFASLWYVPSSFPRLTISSQNAQDWITSLIRFLLNLVVITIITSFKIQIAKYSKHGERSEPLNRLRPFVTYFRCIWKLWVNQWEEWMAVVGSVWWTNDSMRCFKKMKLENSQKHHLNLVKSCDQQQGGKSGEDGKEDRRRTIAGFLHGFSKERCLAKSTSECLGSLRC